MSVGVASFRNAFVRQPDKLISFSLRESKSILIPFPSQSPSLPADKGTCAFIRPTRARFPSYLLISETADDNKYTSQRIPRNKKTHYCISIIVYVEQSRNTFSLLEKLVDHFSCRGCIIAREKQLYRYLK